MQRVSLDAFVRSPVGHCVVNGPTLVFCASPTLCGGMLWGAPTADDYSLIVDGEAAVDGQEGELRITVTRAVLHRPGAPRQATGSSCGSDCVPLI